MSLVFLLVSLSSCSVILESDPQQVIQKVNFRVRVPCVPSSPLGCLSHPPVSCLPCAGAARARGERKGGPKLL